MKYFLIIGFLTFLTSFASHAACCTYTINMQDSWGDGWNGASLNVTVNGAFVGNYTIGGSSGSGSFTACDGDNISVSFVSGTWDSEISYQITNPGGQVYAATWPNAGVNYAGAGNCSGGGGGGGGGGGTNNEYCDQMQPICTDAGLNFTALDGGVNASTLDPGNNYGCLITQPNPTWYYLEIATAGNIDMNLYAPSDIDYIIYGPYASLAAAENDCGTMGSPAGEIIDCSFSATNNEFPSIPNAQVGQVYVMLITNYANMVQNITLTQVGGTGATDCGIVFPCNLDYFEVNISACNPATNTFSLSGVVEFTSPPATGQLIVEDCNGNQQVFGTPFTSPTNYNITGIPANGAACDITAYFTDDITCTQTISYTNPASCAPSCFINYMSTNISACDPNTNSFSVSGELQFTNPPASGQLIFEDCNGNQQVFNWPFTSPTFYNLANLPSDGTLNCDVTAWFTAAPACTMTSLLYDNPDGCTCSADAGTYTATTIGNTNSNGPYSLCFGDELDIVANGDYEAPDDYTGVIAAVYDPGVWLLVYDCPPTIGPPNTINNDPCLLGVASTYNQAWTIINDIGDGSTLYFVPVTMYSMVDGIYAISINNGEWCYDLGPTYQVNFLEDITAVPTENCSNGTVSVLMGGGYPAFNGSSFTGSNLLPASASFVTGTAPDGGTIVVGGLQDGDNYSFDITDANGCPVTITGTFTGAQDPSFSYPDNAYCKNEANPAATITGTPGGTFSATPGGLSINSFTGLINLAASTVGTYTVTYTTPGPVCPGSQTFTITVNPQPTVDGNDPVVCQGQSVTLNGTGADTYIWTGGVTNGVSFVPAISGSYTVTGTITATGCSNTGVSNVTVNPVDNASFTVANFCPGSPSPAAVITGTPGGTFSFNPNPNDGSTIDPSTGSISNGVGGTTYTIQYTTLGVCPATSTQQATVVLNAPINAGPDVAICIGESTTLVASGGSTYNWQLPIGAAGASQNVSPVVTTTYTVDGVNAQGCAGSDQVTVTVNALPIVDAGNNVGVCDGVQVTLTANGASTYVWNPSVTQGVPFTPGVGTTTYTVTGTDGNGCEDTDQVDVTVFSLPTVIAGPDQTVCFGEQVTVNASGAQSYVWNGGVAQGVSFTPALGQTTLTVTGTDANGCVDTDDLVITATPIPTVNAGSDFIICEGATAVLTATGAQSYVWTGNVVNGVPFTPVSSGTYTVTGTDANGCEDTDDVLVTIEPLPNVDFVADVTSGCAPLTVTFTNLTQGNMTDCIWSFSNGTTATGCGSVTITFNSGGLFDATLTTTSVNGCTNSLTYDDYIYVEDEPIASFMPSTSVASVLNPVIQFNNTSSGAVSYQWDFGDESPTTSEVHPIHEFPGEGQATFVVELIAYSELGCTDTAYRTIVINEELIFYVPNTFTPDGDDFNEYFQPVFSSGYDPYDFSLLIFDRWGEIIWESHDASVGWDGTYGIDHGNKVQDGTYTWKIEFKTTMNDARVLVVGHVNVLN